MLWWSRLFFHDFWILGELFIALKSKVQNYKIIFTKLFDCFKTTIIFATANQNNNYYE
jgi:hypothetical protein